MQPERWNILARRFWRASCCAGDTVGFRRNGRSPRCSVRFPLAGVVGVPNGQGTDEMCSMHFVPGRVRDTAAASHTLRELLDRDGPLCIEMNQLW